jgi:hypothetical protein
MEMAFPADTYTSSPDECEDPHACRLVHFAEDR